MRVRLNAACGLAITLILPMACIAGSMQSSTGFSMGAFNRSIPYQDALDDAGISQTQLNSIINNSLIQGNGDVNSILYAKDSKLVLELAKNDVYDARIDTSNDHPLLKIDVANHSWSGTVAIPSSWDKPYPEPRVCAKIVIGSSGSFASVLDLRRAVADINDGEIKVRALAQANAYYIQTAHAVQLQPVLHSHIPTAQQGITNGVAWITQQLPPAPDPDWKGMSFAVAMAQAGSRKAISVVTSLESEDPKTEAITLAQWVLENSEQTLIKRHEDIWRAFWSAGGIDMEERDLSKLWYRNLYFLRCVSRPGAQAVGLFAGPMLDSGGWHDNYTINYNVEQTFWGSIICNHVELAEPYVRLFHRYLPRARWFAEQTYGIDGAYYPHNLYKHEVVDPMICISRNNRMFAAGPWGYTIGLSGYALHNIWLCYKYEPNPHYLENYAYPVIRDVCEFYLNFVDLCKTDGNGKKILGPSVSPEHGTIGIDNCPFDTAFIAFTLKALIEAAETLEKDADMVRRARDSLLVLPDYPKYGTPAVIVDRLGGTPFEYNIPVPITPVFPAEQVTWFSDASEKNLFIRTLNNIATNGNNSMIMLSVARARLSMPDTWLYMKNAMLARQKPNGALNLNTVGAFNAFGHYTEQFACCGAIAELLLQSVDGIVRVFPAWPATHDAKFKSLRAQGGFLISAEQIAQEVTRIEVLSTTGGVFRLLSPWPSAEVSWLRTGITQTLRPDAKGVLAFETQPGDKVVFGRR